MSDEPKVYRVKLGDLIPDVKNANLGTERGRYMLEQSLQRFGAGRSILVDRDGRIIAGNKTGEVAGEIGIDSVVVVETDGHELVAVKRNDLDLEEDEQARLLAYADNRVSEVDLAFDPAQIVTDIEVGLDLSDIWYPEELEFLMEQTLGSRESWDEAFGGLPDGDRAPFQQMTFTLHDGQVEEVKRALSLAKHMGDFGDSPNENSNGNALAFVCEIFVTTVGDGQG